MRPNLYQSVDCRMLSSVTESPSGVTMFLGVVATRPTAVYISAIDEPFLVIPESLTNALKGLGRRSESVENFLPKKACELSSDLGNLRSYNR